MKSLLLLLLVEISSPSSYYCKVSYPRQIAHFLFCCCLIPSHPILAFLCRSLSSQHASWLLTPCQVGRQTVFLPLLSLVTWTVNSSLITSSSCYSPVKQHILYLLTYSECRTYQLLRCQTTVFLNIFNGALHTFSNLLYVWQCLIFSSSSYKFTQRTVNFICRSRFLVQVHSSAFFLTNLVSASWNEVGVWRRVNRGGEKRVWERSKQVVCCWSHNDLNQRQNGRETIIPGHLSKLSARGPFLLHPSNTHSTVPTIRI